MIDDRHPFTPQPGSRCCVCGMTADAPEHTEPELAPLANTIIHAVDCKFVGQWGAENCTCEPIHE